MIEKKIDLTNIASIDFDRQFTDDVVMLVIDACSKRTRIIGCRNPGGVWSYYELIKKNKFKDTEDLIRIMDFGGQSGAIILISLYVLIYFAERIEPKYDYEPIKKRLNRELLFRGRYVEIKNQLIKELDVMIDVPAKEPDEQKVLSLIDGVKKEIEELRAWGKRHEQRAKYYQSEAQTMADELARLKEANKTMAEENSKLKNQKATNPQKLETACESKGQVHDPLKESVIG